MSLSVAAALFQSRGRTAVLELVGRQRAVLSTSELARRSKLSPRSVRMEVAHLRRLGLVTVERLGTADMVRFEARHPAAKPLLALLDLPAVPVADGREALVRKSLAAWGAPLLVDSPERNLSLQETLVEALALARRDGSVLRVLPTFLAQHADDLDWVLLKEEVRRRKLTAELGAVTELAAAFSGRSELATRVKELRDRRVQTPRYLPEARNEFERRLAEERSPPQARKWGLRMNLSEESFRATYERTRA